MIDSAGWVKVILELGATGALIVVFAYTFVKILPTERKNDRDERKDEREKFLGALQSQRDDYRVERKTDRDERKGERDSHANQLERILKANGHGG